jgi:hypothetical protein
MTCKRLSRAAVIALLATPAIAVATIVLTSPEIPFNATTTGSQVGARAHSVAVARDGAMVVWQSDDGDGTGVFGRLIESTGLSSEFQINTVTTGPQARASVATATAKGFVVAWSSTDVDGDGYGIAAQRYDSDGVAVGTQFVVNSFTTAGQEAPDVAMADDGSFLVVWESFVQDGDQTGIAARAFDASGAPLGDDFLLNTYTTGGQQQASVAPLAAGGFAVVWESPQDGSGYGVIARVVDAGGAPAGGELAVNAFTTGDQRAAHVGRGEGSDFTVIWSGAASHDADGVAARSIGPGPAPVGGDIGVNAFTTGGQARAAIAGEADGSFVVVWDSASQDGDSYGVFARDFDTTGAPVDSEFQVNTFTTGFQGYTNSISAAGDGNFLIVWADAEQDGDGFGIVGRTLCTDADEDGDCDLRCGPEPALDCRLNAAGKSKISIKNNPDDDTRDQVTWKWSKGDETPIEAFNDPLGTTSDYAFCIYDESTQEQPLMEALIAPGGLCEGEPCWKASGTKGYAFRDDAGTQGGIVKMKLKSGDLGKAQVQVQAKGVNAEMPTPPLTGNVVVQLITATPTFDCWQTTYTVFKKNEVAGGGAIYSASGP